MIQCHDHHPGAAFLFHFLHQRVDELLLVSGEAVVIFQKGFFVRVIAHFDHHPVRLRIVGPAVQEVRGSAEV